MWASQVSITSHNQYGLKCGYMCGQHVKWAEQQNPITHGEQLEQGLAHGRPAALGEHARSKGRILSVGAVVAPQLPQQRRNHLVEVGGHAVLGGEPEGGISH